MPDDDQQPGKLRARVEYLEKVVKLLAKGMKRVEAITVSEYGEGLVEGCEIFGVKFEAEDDE